MRSALTALLAAVTLASLPALAAEVRISATDTVESVLTAQKTKRVTVRLRSGQEMTGTVREITPRLVHLGALSGREFFDAVIAVESIEAVVIRTRD
jgi:hypothetical protein